MDVITDFVKILELKRYTHICKKMSFSETSEN